MIEPKSWKIYARLSQATFHEGERKEPGDKVDDFGRRYYIAQGTQEKSTSRTKCVISVSNTAPTSPYRQFLQ